MQCAQNLLTNTRTEKKSLLIFAWDLKTTTSYKYVCPSHVPPTPPVFRLVLLHTEAIVQKILHPSVCQQSSSYVFFRVWAPPPDPTGAPWGPHPHPPWGWGIDFELFWNPFGSQRKNLWEGFESHAIWPKKNFFFNCCRSCIVVTQLVAARFYAVGRSQSLC